jgi:hypothetical protein
MMLKRYGTEVPDIGCTIKQTGTTKSPGGVDRPQFEVTPNDPDAYRRLIEIVTADVAGPKVAS